MPTVKKISIEFGDDFMVADFALTDGDTAKVIGTVDDEARVRWVSEAASRKEEAEDFCLKNAQAIFNGMLHVTTE